MTLGSVIYTSCISTVSRSEVTWRDHFDHIPRTSQLYNLIAIELLFTLTFYVLVTKANTIDLICTYFDSFVTCIIIRGRPYKDVRTKSWKINPSHFSEKCSHWLNTTPPCPCGHTKILKNPEIFEILQTHQNFKKSGEFYTKKFRRPHLKNPLSPCPKNVRTGLTPLAADVLYGQPLRSCCYRYISKKQKWVRAT